MKNLFKISFDISYTEGEWLGGGDATKAFDSRFVVVDGDAFIAISVLDDYLKSDQYGEEKVLEVFIVSVEPIAGDVVIEQDDTESVVE